MSEVLVWKLIVPLIQNLWDQKPGSNRNQILNWNAKSYCMAQNTQTGVIFTTLSIIHKCNAKSPISCRA